MGYIKGQITASATPADDLLAAIEAEMGTEAAWEFVEELVISNYTYRVWRNLGASNDYGTDFYLTFRTLSTDETVFGVAVFEQWDATNDLHLHPAREGGGTIDVTDDCYDHTWHPLTANIQWDAPPVNTTDFNWWALVAKNALIMVTQNGTVGFSYHGLYESFTSAHPNDFPLVWGRTSNGGTSRHPGMSDASTTVSYPTRVDPVSGSTWTSLDGTVPTNLQQGLGDGVSSKVMGSRLAVDWFRPNAVNRGGLYYYLAQFNTDASVNRGDTMTVDGNTWVFIGWSLWMDTLAVAA